MMTKKIRAIGAAVLVSVWSVLTLFAWLGRPEQTSDSERRPLAQFPDLTGSSLLSGKFMTDFESYTLDQFPARDSFRTLKSLTHYYLFGQKDNNDIYMQDGFAAKVEYPLNAGALDYAAGRLSYVYDTYLKEQGSKVFMAIVPDKGYYLAAENGYPALEYQALFDRVAEKLPFAQQISLTDALTAQDYYRTDTHWRQEALLGVAQTISKAMGLTEPKKEDFTQTLVKEDFYGVYYGQAALPMKPESLYVMESDLLAGCKVYNYETDSYTGVYDMEKLGGKDPYDVFLSGPQSLLRIENPNAATEKELLIFRDSFGSSVAPLLVQDYKTVTLVDIRYLGGPMLKNYLEFNGQDVLFLYSTSVLNNGTTLK